MNKMPCPECMEFMNVSQIRFSSRENKTWLVCHECKCTWNETLTIDVTEHGCDWELKQRVEREKKYKEVISKIQDIEV